MKVKHFENLWKFSAGLFAIFLGLISSFIGYYGLPDFNPAVIFNFGLVFSGLCYGTLFFIWKKIDKLSKESNVKEAIKIGEFDIKDSDFEDPENPTENEIREFIKSKKSLRKEKEKEMPIGPRYLKYVVLPFFLLALVGVMITIIYAETFSQTSYLKILVFILIFYFLGWVMYGIGLKLQHPKLPSAIVRVKDKGEN